MARLAPLALFVVASSIAAVASAQGTESEETLPSYLQHDHAYVHDGFYLRMALGGGGLSSRDHVDTTNSGADVNGGGGAVEVSVGGSPQPGLVVGGSFIAVGAEVGHVHDSAGTTTLSKTAGFALFGAMLDMYPNPRGGFHFTGAIGPAFMSITEDDRVHRTWKNSAGGGVSLGAGYDWWIAPQWSLGFLVRATGAQLFGTTTYDDQTSHTTTESDSRRTVGTLSLSFSALYH